MKFPAFVSQVGIHGTLEINLAVLSKDAHFMKLKFLLLGVRSKEKSSPCAQKDMRKNDQCPMLLKTPINT